MEETDIKKIITENISKDGETQYKTITNIKKYWNNTNPYLRKMIVGYVCVSICFYGVYNYNDGKRALINIRNTNPLATPKEEWDVIKKGIKTYDNFFSALFFPYSFVEKIIPNAVIMLNPKN
jgi:hypothetical protein